MYFYFIFSVLCISYKILTFNILFNIDIYLGWIRVWQISKVK